jgi:hypothetical protein
MRTATARIHGRTRHSRLRARTGRSPSISTRREIGQRPKKSPGPERNLLLVDQEALAMAIDDEFEIAPERTNKTLQCSNRGTPWSALLIAGCEIPREAASEACVMPSCSRISFSEYARCSPTALACSSASRVARTGSASIGRARTSKFARPVPTIAHFPPSEVEDVRHTDRPLPTRTLRTSGSVWPLPDLSRPIKKIAVVVGSKANSIPTDSQSHPNYNHLVMQRK